MNSSETVWETWQQWQRTARPFTNFRQQRTNEATYRLECDLDHQADYVEVLFEAWRDNNLEWDVRARSEHELRDLDLFESQLRELSLPGAQGADIADYIRVTRRLLSAIREEVNTQRGAS
jgi:hypothetical protein